MIALAVEAQYLGPRWQRPPLILRAVAGLARRPHIGDQMSPSGAERFLTSANTPPDTSPEVLNA